MKKALIAGAASTVLAAMPVAASFATGTIYGSPIVDTLDLTVTEVCTLARDLTTPHPNGTSSADTSVQNGGWTTGTVGGVSAATIAGVSNIPTGASRDRFVANVVAGTDYANIAKSTFTVKCNSTVGGYHVTVTTDNFVTGSQSQDDSTWTYETTTPQDGASYWNLQSNGKSDSVIASGADVWTHEASATPFTNDSFTITYNAYPNLEQPQGTYTANAVYQLLNI